MKVHIPFQFDDDFEYGKIHDVSPLIRRIVAPNPSKFTFRGTGTYIVGRGNVAVIDPGPIIESHIAAILNALSEETITHILITHTHSDHSPAAKPLQAACGARIYGCEISRNRSDSEESEPVEESVDSKFSPTVTLKHGQLIKGDGWTMECVHTPGHLSNHFCYRLLEEQALFSGDHVMGWSTSVIIPPDGSMSDYINSLKLLLQGDDKVYYPTHGPPITDPIPFVESFLHHRKQREQEIIECFYQGIDKISGMVAVVYRDIDPALHPAASRSMLATMIKLWEEGRVKCDGKPALNTHYEFVQ